MVPLTPSTPPDDPGRLVQLDTLRAVGLLAIISHHNFDFSNRPFLGDIGNAALATFFTLSGFLITGILLRARATAEAAGVGRGSVIRVFYIRRFFRIFPVYYLVLALVILGGAYDIRHTFPAHALYLTNWLDVWRGQYVFPQHFWSLSVEEQFYLAWAPLALFLPRRWLSPLLLGMLALGPLSRAAFWLGTGIKSTAVTPTTSCMDLIAIGCLLALLQEQGPATAGLRRRLARTGLWIAAALYGVLAYFQIQGGGFLPRITIHTLPFALFAFWYIDRVATVGFQGRIGGLLSWRPLVYLGTISYGAYLFHNLIGLAVAGLESRLGIDLPYPTAPGLARTLVAGSLAILLAMLSWRLYEKPLNDMRRRYPYVRRPPAPESDRALAGSAG